jgi:PAS domain S-box-containing protein
MTSATILVIEDDHIRGPELQERLTSAGYRVLHASLAGTNAIEQVAELHPDLVLMDIAIRGKTDGVQAADLIQSRLEIPVIYIMSNYGYGQATLQRSKATGPFGYIFDPLDAKQIAGTIEVALVRNRLEREIKEGRQWLSTVLNSIGDGVIAVDERGCITFINPIAEVLTGWQAREAVGRPLPEVCSITDEKWRAMVDASFMRSNPSAGEEPPSNIHALLASRNGDRIPVEITLSPIKKGGDTVRGMVLVLRDVTERRRAMEEIKRQANRAEALVQVAAQLNKQTDLGTLLETVCVTTNRSLKATGTALFLLDPKLDCLMNRAAYSEVPLLRALEGNRFELPSEMLESMLSRADPVVVLSDLQSNPALPYSELLSNLKLNTMVIAALFLRDQLMGSLISVFAEDRPAISDDDVALLRGLADQASSAIENAELFEQVRVGRERQHVLAKSLVEVQESERRHVACELHDQLGQALTGLQFMLESAKNQPEEARRANLDEIQEYVGSIMEQTREISLKLRPSMLDDLGLLPTLQWHFDRYSKQTGIKVRFHEDGCVERFASEVETAAYRIVQEALTNTARYAQVKEVVVEMTVREETLWLQIHDEGKGFDPAMDLDKPTSGLGGMRERAGLVGGYVQVESSLGGGTRIIAALPLDGKVLERRKHERNGPAS